MTIATILHRHLVEAGANDEVCELFAKDFPNGLDCGRVYTILSDEVYRRYERIMDGAEEERDRSVWDAWFEQEKRIEEAMATVEKEIQDYNEEAVLERYYFAEKEARDECNRLVESARARYRAIMTCIVIAALNRRN